MESAVTSERTRIKRGAVLRIKVADDTEERLVKLSHAYGLPPSTLAAVALGHWIAHQERALMASDAMNRALAEQLGETLGAEVRQLFAGIAAQGAAGDT